VLLLEHRLEVRRHRRRQHSRVRALARPQPPATRPVALGHPLGLVGVEVRDRRQREPRGHRDQKHDGDAQTYQQAGDRDTRGQQHVRPGLRERVADQQPVELGPRRRSLEIPGH
jgi:hypothetical protein